MKSGIYLFLLVQVAHGLASGAGARPELDPQVPIYLGEVFWPPAMTFIAWLPSEVQKPLEWCYRATDASNSKLFSLGGVDGLQLHDYFTDQAFLTREGDRYANCWVTPESERMGACQGVLDYDCEGGHKFTGPGRRVWSCWVIPEKVKSPAAPGPLASAGEKLTSGDGAQVTITGAMASSSILGAFTAGVTGS